MSKLETKIILNGVDHASKPIINISKNLKTLSKSLTDSKKELTSLNKIQENLNGFTELKNKLTSTSEKLKQAKETAEQLGKALSKTSEPTKKMRSDFEKATQSVKTIKDKFLELQISTQRARDELKKSGISTNNLANGQVKLRQSINQTTENIKKQQAQLNKLNAHYQKSAQIRQKYDKSMQSLAVAGGVGYGAMYTGKKVATGLQHLLSVGYDFDASMSATQAVTGIKDKYDPRMLSIRDQARTLPLESKFTDSEVAQGQYFLAQAGFTAQELVNAMPGMVDLAAAGNIDLGLAADISSGILRAMQIPAENMQRVADVVAAVSTKSKIEIADLGEALKYSAAIGAGFGQSLETIVAITGVMGNANIQGSQSGTTLRQILTKIGDSKIVKSLGVKTADENGNMRDLVDIFEDIAEATKHMGNVERGALNKKIAGQIGLTGFEVILNESVDGKLRAFRGNDGDSDGEASRIAKTKLDNLKGDMTMLHAAFENISVELFEKNNEWLRKGIKGFTDFLHSFGEFLKRHPALSKAIVGIGAGLAALTATFGALALTIMSVFGPMLMTRFLFARMGLSMGSVIGKGGLFSKALTGIGSVAKFLVGPLKFLITVIRAVGLAFLTNPIGWVIMLIAGAAFLIYKYWGPIKDVFINLFDTISEKWETFKNKFAGIAVIGGLLIDYLIEGMKNGWEKISTLVSSLATDIGDWFNEKLYLFTGIGGFIIDGLIEGIQNGWEFIKNKITSLATSIGDWFKDILGINSPSKVFVEFGGFIMDGLINGISNMWNKLKDTVSKLASSVANWFKNILGIKTEETMPAMHSLSNNLAEMQANGGQGSNLAIAQSPSSVAAPNIYITVNAAQGMDERALANMVAMNVQREISKTNNFRTSMRDID